MLVMKIVRFTHCVMRTIHDNMDFMYNFVRCLKSADSGLAFHCGDGVCIII